MQQELSTTTPELARKRPPLGDAGAPLPARGNVAIDASPSAQGFFAAKVGSSRFLFSGESTFAPRSRARLGGPCGAR
jgi:hypothetical protein